MYEASSSGGFEGLGMFFNLLFIAIYLYFAFAQFKIAKKLRHDNAWFAWIPILQFVQLVQLAKKPMYWFLLCLIPVINIVCFAILYIEIAKAVGCSPAVGFFTIIPPISFITIGVMAFSSPKQVASQPPPQQTPAPRQPQNVG